MADRNASVQHCVNKWGARVVPFVLCGIVGYVTWVVVVLLGVNYLLRGLSDGTKHTGAGIAVIAVHFVLFFPMAICYFRTLQIVFANPGVVPLASSSKSTYSSTSVPTSSSSANGPESEKPTNPAFPHDPSQPPAPLPRKGFFDRGGVLNGRIPAPPGLEPFIRRSIYECDIDGLPRYCATCQLWKPDRSHHSSELDRCVYKMDHYCPWAGGMVAEPSFNFFVQFCSYACIFCIFILVVAAYHLATLNYIDSFYQINLIVVTVLAGVFFLFTAGMAGNSLHFAGVSTTTVDNLTRRNRIYNFAVLISDSADPSIGARNRTGFASGPENPFPQGPFATITYPLQQSTSIANAVDTAATGNTGPAAAQPIQQTRRTYAIIATPTGSNPYKLSSALDNFKTVMGNRVTDWFLPIRHSPCYTDRLATEHHLDDLERGGNANALYALGPDFDEALAQAGLYLPGRTKSGKASNVGADDEKSGLRRGLGVSEKHKKPSSGRRRSKSDGGRSRSRQGSASRGANGDTASGDDTRETTERRHRKERRRRRRSASSGGSRHSRGEAGGGTR